MPLTERENFMKVINGETPEWVPSFTFGPDPFATKPPQATSIMSSFLPRGERSAEGFTDMFGVKYVSTEDTGGMSLPEPNNFILDDIRNWRDVIKVPDISDVNWDMVAKRDIDGFAFDPKDVAVMFGGTNTGFFLNLMNFMGFTNGLIAMHEEPDEVKDLFTYLADWYCTVIENTIDRYPFDIFTIGDDTAAADYPFISPAMHSELQKPFVARVTKYAMERGLPIMMHCCGRCEDFIEDWREVGVNSWNPAQVTNDLDAIKQKYGNDLVLIGCWDSSGPAGWPNAPEELVRQAVRDCIDRYAPGGGFMFLGSVYGPVGDTGVDDKRRWMTQEYEAYRETPYK